jgi:hypothetical protein
VYSRCRHGVHRISLSREGLTTCHRGTRGGLIVGVAKPLIFDVAMFSASDRITASRPASHLCIAFRFPSTRFFAAMAKHNLCQCVTGVESDVSVPPAYRAGVAMRGACLLDNNSRLAPKNFHARLIRSAVLYPPTCSTYLHGCTCAGTHIFNLL